MKRSTRRRVFFLVGGAVIGVLLGLTALAGPLDVVPGLGLMAAWATVLGGVGYQLSRREERLRGDLGTDPVTQLGNQSLFKQRSAEEVDRAVRHHFPLALLLIEIERADREADEAALRLVADCLRRACRSTDVICRYGAIQFTLLAPLTTARQAVQLVDRIRASVTSLSRCTPGCPNLSVAIGLAELAEARSFDPDALLEAADQALQIERIARRRVAQMGRSKIVGLTKLQGSVGR
jgi:diguanylate cyclase (GGDEF)-like protein